MECLIGEVFSRKKELRRMMLARRRSLHEAERESASQAIWQLLQREEIYQRAHIIFAYAAMADEVQTLPVLQAMLEAGKRVYLPCIGQGRNMRPVELKSMGALVAGKYGILTVEASKSEFISPAELDCILIPGVAFDRKGNRLGMGGGFYDTLLPQAERASRLAMAFFCQMVEDIPCEPHDCRMDKIITELEVISCNHINN